MSFSNFALIFVGGGLGSVVRFLAAQFLSFKHFPLATFVVNVVGSFFIGWIIASSLSQNNNLKLLLATGFCGGFTTFSTFSLEVFQLFQQQKFIVAIAYIFFSLVLSIAFTALGFYFANSSK